MNGLIQLVTSNAINPIPNTDLSAFASGYIERELNKRDPYKIWTWDASSRRSYRGYMKKQLPMWHKYRVEFYPHYGQHSGITMDKTQRILETFNVRFKAEIEEPVLKPRKVKNPPLFP